MMHLLHLQGLPIFQQLQIEEALLRTDTRNVCIINTHAPPAIVMGISAKVERLIDIALVKKDQIPVIQRCSGGGTVFIDEGTLFVSFIGNDSDFPFELSPQGLMQWSKGIYEPLFERLDFQLRENDYCVGDKKIGGNAQYLRKGRFLHHTSFLWNFIPTKMDYLLMPEKRPVYRGDRSHVDFLSSLSTYFPSQTIWVDRFKSHLKTKFQAQEISLASVRDACERPHRKATNMFILK